jgi:hypothetical protein
VIDGGRFVGFQVVNNSVYHYCGVFVGLFAQLVKGVMPANPTTLQPGRSCRVAKP